MPGRVHDAPKLYRQPVALAGHDRSDGGLVVIPASVDTSVYLGVLFAEDLVQAFEIDVKAAFAEPFIKVGSVVSVSIDGHVVLTNTIKTPSGKLTFTPSSALPTRHERRICYA
ncbi:hypothetical protein SPRG_16041 [Saprolegnia parasitica CBS 223.65]|uniref:Uncharacterized protein n=1 Tax=Saprolegnia parasitica (strain CBS 223.65) TaxID=695850 RepID=A0A067BVB8_SAPPC|nr:hypothetical protein SPRG_16041 [Saprolegnia parasitica CBS 223.65]KDO18572.1 hypothetical protein SPRG_16041 [Saprolegnia parasitica CBS 223.65]|eukprot:XP_012210723.1 hypothetical protein SPRG_16041 [Saprolegnia parasitica CBS 223.65]